ncbi:imidazolonepropionase-like amidohydrolase [Blastomonas natatoria]|uniref:Imidazolonepropionase-like amidohydrolase n=1 Tax=Blastomonas natatoria TaxID=34015 RepID=A0A2V3UVT3_9SPHN|nr:amidohydrolase family protein [Blastomonas natatoria]PXW73360.1 imidazolonepropionase-like amidohydrolase [Blastomonas natatoria]
MGAKTLKFGSIALALAIAPWGMPAFAQDSTENFIVIIGGTKVGHLDVVRTGDTVKIDYDYKNNGRGPTMKEELKLDPKGMPVAWKITGNSTFGNAINESFTMQRGTARWTDSTGSGSAKPKGQAIYVAQEGSPWAAGLYARALLADDDRSIPALPGGALSLAELEKVQVTGTGGAMTVTAYALSGNDLDPGYFLLDDKGALFAAISPRAVFVRRGFEGEDIKLRDLAVKYSTERFVKMQAKAAHSYKAPVRITNVRVFDPVSMTLTEPKSVVVRGRRIAAVLPANSPATPGEISIDGEGGTLVPGLYEMHGHIGQEDAMLNVLAGITSVRDMGNEIDVLDGLVERIESGVLAGPRITKSGFIEGKSPFSSNNGILVNSQQEAIDAARFYAARDFQAIKIYNSMNPEWIPALVKEAKALGLHVMGHVPAFTNADAMIAAGYDEMTHINQVMLGWVLEPGEDTRTLLRLTALKRLPGLDLNSGRVNATIRAMVENKVTIDPTFAIHESLLLSRNGMINPGMTDYVDHMPVGVQRSAKQAWAKIDDAADDKAYRGAFDQVAAAIRKMHEAGIFLIPGTDMGGSFTYHRELELYQKAGMTPAQILRRATYDMAQYLKQDQSLGSIEKGKLADFFLIQGDPTKDLKAIKAIRMVAKDGVFYYPSEVYPEFGIKPFATRPKVKLPK